MSGHVAVQFLPGTRRAQVAPGTTLLDAARRAEVALEAPCDGAGICGKCLVRLEPEALLALEPGVEVRTGGNIPGALVLACCARARAPLTVTVPQNADEGLAIIDHGDAAGWPLEPHIALCRAGEEVVVRAGDQPIATLRSSAPVANLGIAVDIGTTTLVVALVDLESGRELSVGSALNPQTAYGHDVLSRIRFAAEPDGLLLLSAVLMRELNVLIAQVCHRSGVEVHHVHEAVLAGNTCMLHIAAGLDPAPLGRAPYAPSSTRAMSLPAAQIGLAIAEHGRVYLPPVVSGFVGADIAAGILAADLQRTSTTTLLLDIGTNGEMVLAHRGRMWATSTAAGPAFEGVNITCGMRASAGAIDGVSAREDGRLTLHTIRDAPAVGICGSGLVDLVSCLIASGAVSRSGRFEPALQPPFGAWDDRSGRPVLRLSGEVVLTQKDVRQVQLAKGAVRAGLEVLLERAGLAVGEVGRVLIAGSFGYHLRGESLATLGLLPKALADRVEAAGNTSKAGAVTLLTSQSARRALDAAAANVGPVELSEDGSFERRFVRHMAFGDS